MPSPRSTHAPRSVPASTLLAGSTSSPRKRPWPATRPRRSSPIAQGRLRGSSEASLNPCCAARARRQTQPCSRSEAGTAAAFSGSCSAIPPPSSCTTASVRPWWARPQPGKEWQPGTVVVGLDGSGSALAAVKAADDLAARLGAAVEVVSATGSDAAQPDGGWADRVDTWDAKHPVAALLERSARADLLVVGSRGQHGLRALGSVSERSRTTPAAPSSSRTKTRPFAKPDDRRRRSFVERRSSHRPDTGGSTPPHLVNGDRRADRRELVDDGRLGYGQSDTTVRGRVRGDVRGSVERDAAVEVAGVGEPDLVRV